MFTVTQGQTNIDPMPDNRQYKDQYLLPEVMTNDNNCLIDFDVSICGKNQYELYKRGYHLLGHSGLGFFYGCNIVDDYAQPYRTDTTITIIGLSGYFSYNYPTYYELPYYYYLELRDSINNEIIRSVNVLDFYPAVRSDTIDRYKEVLFDSPINIKGKFYVVLHTLDSIENYDSLKIGGTPFCVVTSLCTPSSNDMYPLFKNLNSCEWSTARYGANMATMFYLFPILGEYDPNAETYNGSKEVGINELEDIAVIPYVFPNPVTEEVNINCGYKIKNVELYDEQGKLLYTKDVNAYNHKISIADYLQGTYFVKILTQTGQTTKKIIKK